MQKLIKLCGCKKITTKKLLLNNLITLASLYLKVAGLLLTKSKTL